MCFSDATADTGGTPDCQSFLFWFQMNIFLLPAEAALVIYISPADLNISLSDVDLCHLIGLNPFENPDLLVPSLLFLLISHIDHNPKYNCRLDYRSSVFLLSPWILTFWLCELLQVCQDRGAHVGGG